MYRRARVLDKFRTVSSTRFKVAPRVIKHSENTFPNATTIKRKSWEIIVMGSPWNPKVTQRPQRGRRETKHIEEVVFLGPMLESLLVYFHKHADLGWKFEGFGMQCKTKTEHTQQIEISGQPDMHKVK